MNKFNEGDKVRIMQRESTHEILEVMDWYDGTFYKLSDSSDLWREEYLTLVERYDRRKDFLARLQSLLREFDAEIEFWYDYIDECCGTIVKVGGSEIDRYEAYRITADNVMDFDKE